MLDPDRARLPEQADRARARPRGEDGQDARRPRPREARRHRPDAGGGDRRARRLSDCCDAAILGPILARLLRQDHCPGARTGSPTVGHARSAIVTGASRGLGLALARALAARGWRLVVDARDGDALARRGRASPATGRRDRRRRRRRPRTGRARRRRRRPASTCSSTTRACSGRARSRRSPTTRSTSSRASTRSTCFAPLALVQLALPRPAAGGGIVNVTSDAAVEPYEGWGGYGSSKAALEQLTAILAAEHPELRVYAVDPGDMRTQMHQEAFPGEDISDRPLPEASVPGLLALIEGDAAERPLPRRRPRRGRGMSAVSSRRDRRLEAHRAARGARAAAATTCACWSRRRHDGIARARALRRPAALPRRRRPARRQHLGDAAGRARRARRGRRARSSCTSRRRSPPSRWVVELRPATARAVPRPADPASRSTLPDGGARRAARALRRQRPPVASRRLDLADAAATLPRRVHGRPIRYGYVRGHWPLDAYQNVFARRAGQRRDAERRPPVHARSWSPALVARASCVAPVALHTGVSSLERDEPPYPERYRVPSATARLVNAVRELAAAA